MPNKDIHGFQATEQINAPKGKNYLLAIGIDQYVHCPKLHNAVKDAKEIVGILKRRFQFDEPNIQELYNQDATKRNIYKAFRTLAQKITPTDNLLIYFSGHGEYDKLFNIGYWIPINAEKAAVDQYVPNSEIKNILSAIKSHHTFLMVDSCFSGALFAKGSSRNVSLRKERDPSRWGLTAGRNEIVTDGEKGTNSPFAKSILYQLKNTDKPIGVAELCDKVLEVVSANANQTPRGEPLKVEGHQGGQFVFHLRKDEVADWKETLELNSIAAFQSFLVKYPKGKYADEAKAAIKKRQAETLWQKITIAQDEALPELKSKLRLVNQYVDQYEDQPHYDEALNVGELLEYKKAFFNAKDSEFALRRFIRKAVPKVAGAEDIAGEARTILEETNRDEATKQAEAEARRVQEQQKAIRQANGDKERQQAVTQRKAIEAREKQKAEFVRRKGLHGMTKLSTIAVDLFDFIFYKKNSKYMVMSLLLPFLIWGIVKIINNGEDASPISTVKTEDILGKELLNDEDLFDSNEKAIAMMDKHTNAELEEKIDSVKSNKQSDTNLPVIHSESEIISTDVSLGNYLVIAGTFKIKSGAQVLARELRNNGFTKSKAKASIRDKGAFSVVLVDRFHSRSEANDLAKQLKYKGTEAYVQALRPRDESEEQISKSPEKTKTNRGSFTDSRDGQTYKWVRLKDGKKWMSENLNYTISDSWCNENKESNCRKYGRLYTWKAAMKACPKGWRVPSDDEWWKMTSLYGKAYSSSKGNVSINAGKAAYKALLIGGNSGFSALLGDYRNSDGAFFGFNGNGRYWSSTEKGINNVWFYDFLSWGKELGRLNLNKNWGFSCRCIQD